jgi:hypothetical protein
MKNLSSSDIQELVTKAFVIEALTDKPGCTTRYEDLPDKPLQDFVIAGINSSKAFELFTRALRDSATTSVYSYNVTALRSANKHKSAKFINFGLLEIMFPVVAGRLMSDDPDKVIDKVIELTKNTTNEDVRHLLEARKLAWSTSETPHKVGFSPDRYKSLETVWDFYMAMDKDFPPESSNFQWAEQFRQKLPILRGFFDKYLEMGEVMQTTKTIFAEQKAANPQVAVGIIADMCAAAIFLWLSFNEDTI